MNLNDILKRAALTEKGIIFVDSSSSTTFLTYSELYASALQALGFLQRHKLKAGDEVVFQIVEYRTFLIFFWACILGGFIPVPLAIADTDERRLKVINVWSKLRTPFLIISAGLKEKICLRSNSDFMRILSGLLASSIEVDHMMLREESIGIENASLEGDIAFIQFSSGSTGNPKGVVLTHRNLIANISASEKCSKHTADDVMLSWMPLTHDMGLIGFHLNPLYSGMNQVLIPTELFVRRPALWLESASKYRATILCSPNFGYHHLLTQLEHQENFSWDLSNVRLLYNGAEPISVSLCHRFLLKMAKFGLKSAAMYPVYGLAEATLAVSFSGIHDEVSAVNIARGALDVGNHVRELPVEDVEGVSFVRVGRENGYCCSIRIVDNKDQVVANATVGHVQLRGDNVTSGYYNDPVATAKFLTHDGWARTGDLGFFRNGDFYITGRSKDVIFVNGQNYYAHDLERCLEEIDGIKAGRVVAAGCTSHISAEEQVLIFVLHKGTIEKFVDLWQRIMLFFNHRFGFAPTHVIPVSSLPKTTSGKLQRYRLVESYQSDAYSDVIRQLNSFAKPDDARALENDPANEIEMKLKGIWTDVLGHANFGVTDDFYRSGGDSLKMGRVLALIQRRFDAHLDYQDSARGVTIRKLASLIESRQKTTFKAIGKAMVTEHYLPSSGQKRLFSVWSADPDSTAYNVPATFTLHEKIDVDRLANSIGIVASRHQALRSFFVVEEGTLTLAFVKKLDFELPVSNVDSNYLHEALVKRIRPFNLLKAPLFRAELLMTGEAEYVLFLDFHHIIVDGLSVTIFLNDLFSAYRGADLSATEIQYADFLSWEASEDTQIAYRSHERYWRDMFQSGVPRLNIQTDFQRPKLLGFAGSKMKIPVDAVLSQKLRTLAAHEKATLFTILFSAYTVLLSKYCNQNDLVVGVPVSGRQHPQIFGLIGMFVNNLAIRCELQNDQSFAQYLQRVNQEFLESLSNQEYPFEALVNLVNEKRDVSRNSVFDTMFIYQHAIEPEMKTSGMSIERLYFDPGISKYDISLEVVESTGEFHFFIEYSTALFSASTIERFGKHFITLLKCIVEDPQRSISDLSMIDDHEMATLITRSRGGHMEYPRDARIEQLFEIQVKRNPEGLAVFQEAGALGSPVALTFDELNKKSNQLANYLRSLNCGVNRTIAVWQERTADLIVSIIAILKTDNHFLPIDRKTPRGRFRFMLSDSEVGILLADAAVPADVIAADPGARPVTIVNINDCPYTMQSEILSENRTQCDLAYVIYTSGTTGNPKGVKISHQSLVNYAISCDKNFVRDEVVSFPLYSSISFDLTITSIFVPLISGNTIYVYTDDDELTIQRVVTDDKVQIIKATPSHLKIMKEAAIFRHRGKPSNVKRLIIGGENLSTQLAAEIGNLFNDDVEIFNEYGPTEATVGCMIYKFDRKKDHMTSVPIGIPINNTQVYLLDPSKRPVPVGVPGELYLAGDCLAKGYVSKADLEEARFVNNPFLKSSKMYKTGDIAVRLHDHNLYFLGRADRQVKINGHRIELDEIENRLLQHPQVSDAVVLKKLNTYSGAYLCAYVVPDAIHANRNEPAYKQDLMTFMADYLPKYAIPAHFICLNQIPLTQNGKVSYADLPEPDIQDEVVFEEPTTEIEKLIAEVWQNILQKTRVGVLDNFFDLGGDSIKAVQITSRLLGKDISLSVRDIMSYQSIKRICISGAVSNGARRYSQGVLTGDIGISPTYRWFLGRNFANPDYFNQSVLLKFSGPINETALNNSLAFLIRHHDGLRMNYDKVRARMFVNNNSLEIPLHIPIFDLTALDSKAVAKEIEKRCSALKSSFDITNDLLVRAAVILLDSCSYLFITAHHLVIDGVSWRILLEDFYNAYRSFEEGKILAIPPKTASIADWCSKFADDTHSNVKETGSHANGYGSFTTSPMPAKDNVSWLVADVSCVKTILDKELTQSLLAHAHKSYKTDLRTLLNVALARSMAAWTNRADVIIEQEGHGRDLEGTDVSRTVGWFTTFYPVRLKVSGMDIAHNILEIKDQLANVQGRPHRYRDTLSEALRIRGENDVIPDVSLNYLGEFGTELDNSLFSFDDIYTGSDSDPRNSMTAKLEVNCMVFSGELRIEVRYNRKVHDKAEIESVKENLQENLVAIARLETAKKSDMFRPSDFSIELDKQDIDMLFN